MRARNARMGGTGPGRGAGNGGGMAARTAPAPAAPAAPASAAAGPGLAAAPPQAGRWASVGAALLLALVAVAAEREAAAADGGSLLSPPPATIPLPPLPPPVIPEDRIRFSHKQHIDQRVECGDCHGGIPEATTVEATALPRMADCFECHGDRKDDCGMCHTHKAKPSATFPRPAPGTLVFDHREHLSRQGVSCATCHAGTRESTSVEDNLRPRHPVCRSCHQREFDRLDCRYCHPHPPDIRSGPTEEAVHGVGFFPVHGAWAMGSATLCGTCHEPTFCADCHARTTSVRPSMVLPDRVDRTLVHRGDFLGRHALEADARPGSCATCHGRRFCLDCHERIEVAPKAGESFPDAPPSPHPPGYVTRGGTAFHGSDARVSIQRCVACHDQGAASICVACHRVGGFGGNPHPPGWDDRRDAEEARTGNRMCRTCHVR